MRNKDENENDSFLKVQKELQVDLIDVENEKAEFIDVDQLDMELEVTIRKNES
jgi:hypothetical protein